MHVGFDASALENNTTGAGAYQRHLLAALLALPDGPDVTVYAPRGAALPEHPRLTRRELPWRPGARTARILLGALTWRRRWAADALDLLHVPTYYLPPGAPPASVLTVYDVRHARHPHTYPVGRLAFLRSTVGWSLRRARHVIAISEFTKRDLVEAYGVPPEKVTVTHLAAGPGFGPVKEPAALDRVRGRLQLPPRFILSVGSHEPRKNLVRTIEALGLLRSRGLPHHLVVAGMAYFGEGPIRSAIARLGLQDRVHVVGFVRDDDLPALYGLADAFVYPSLHEGFGIPVLEAMACGTPVAASNATAIPEAAGQAALLFGPTDVEAMAGALARLLEDGETAARLRVAGTAQAARFSWERTARETLAVYRRVLGEARD